MLTYLGTVCALSLALTWMAIRQRDVRLNSLFFITVVFLIVFAVCPAVLIFSPPPPADLERLPWLTALPRGDGAFRATAPLVLIAFVSIYIGYFLPVRHRYLRPFVASDPSLLLGAATIFAAAGLLSLIAFAEMVGGFAALIAKANALRQGTPDLGGVTNFAFVKRGALFCLPSAVFYLCALPGVSETRRTLVIAVAAVMSLASLFVLVTTSGRLMFVAFLIPFFVPFAQRSWRRILMFGAAVGAVSIPVVLFGKTILNVLTGQTSAPAIGSAGGALKSIIMEFAFPIVNLTHAAGPRPDYLTYRLFIDAPLSLLRLIPSRLLELGLPPRLADLNTIDLVGYTSYGVPVDLVTFGLYSLGFTGVALTGIVFGAAARTVEWLIRPVSYGASVFRGTWMVLFGFLVMYGSPEWLVVEQFHWLVALGTYGLIGYYGRGYRSFRSEPGGPQIAGPSSATAHAGETDPLKVDQSVALMHHKGTG